MVHHTSSRCVQLIMAIDIQTSGTVIPSAGTSHNICNTLRWRTDLCTSAMSLAAAVGYPTFSPTFRTVPVQVHHQPARRPLESQLTPHTPLAGSQMPIPSQVCLRF
jgi:hypothetical protein